MWKSLQIFFRSCHHLDSLVGINDLLFKNTELEKESNMENVPLIYNVCEDEASYDVKPLYFFSHKTFRHIKKHLSLIPINKEKRDRLKIQKKIE